MIKKIVITILCLSLFSCQSIKEDDNVESVSNRKIEEGLVLYNATLEQSNPEGQTIWKLGTEKVVYSQDKKTATLTNITGNLFSNNKIILKVSAKQGTIKQDGEEIYLKEDIIAFDPRNKAEFKGKELEWRPNENIVILKNGIKANHEKLSVSAKESTYLTDKQKLEMKGNIIATAKNPPLQMKTEHLFWEIPQNKIIGNKPLNMTRYKGKIITDQVKTNKVTVNLKSKLATIQGNIEYKSLEPPVQVATNIIYWQYEKRIIDVKQPMKLLHTKDNMTATSNEANINLPQNMAYLYKGVYAEAPKEKAKLYSDHIAWNIKTKEMEATGNVYYQQANPNFNLRGIRAVGRLKDKNIVITGDNTKQVLSTIYPPKKN